MSRKQLTFNLELPNGQIISLPPKKVVTNLDIYNYVKIYHNIDDLILYYDSIPVPKNKKINMIDIGYDPFKMLYMKLNEFKEYSFNIPKYCYRLIREFNLYQTVFDIKIFFAKEFMTIAQSIIIKNNSKVLSDDDCISERSDYEVDVIEGYSLFKVFFSKFIFICLPNDSTFNDLKSTLAGYSNLSFIGIQFGPYLNKILSTISQPDDEKILEYSSKVAVFDFQYVNHDILGELKINVLPDKDQIYQYNMPSFYNTTSTQPRYVLNTIMCFLEKRIHVDRDAFTHIIDQKKKNSYSICSFKKLYARINDKEDVFPYLLTVKELKKMLSKKDNNVGIVINGHFVFDDSDFLAKYLSSPNSEKSPIRIKIIRSDTSCRLCEIELGKKMVKRSFIIPTNYTFNQITTVYLEKKANSIQYFSGFKIEGSSLSSPFNNTDTLKCTNSKEFWTDLTHNLVVNYTFVEDKKDYTIVMSNENNPQIKDLLLEISKKHNKPFCTHEAFIQHKRVDFWEFLVNIIDQKLEIRTYECPMKHLAVYDGRTGLLCKIKSDIYNVTVESIIDVLSDGNDPSNYSVYLNFHKLSPKDKPAILYNPYGIMIFNENVPEIDLNVSNCYGIDTRINVRYGPNPLISEILLYEFGLNVIDVNFELKIPDSWNLEMNEFYLPTGFDVGSIPKNSQILIQYNELRVNKITFCYENGKEKVQSTVTLSEPTEAIRYLKREIIEQMKLFNIAPKVVRFEFLGVQLNQNNTFSSYGIAENSIINIVCKKISKKITVRLFNDFELGNYFLEKESTVKDIIQMLKTEYKIDDPDYKLEIYSQGDNESLLDIDRPLVNKEILYASFEKVKIRLLEPNGKRLEFDEIIRPTKEFIEEDIIPIIHDDDNSHFVLYRRESKGHFIPVDCTKTFREIGDMQYFLFKRLFGIKFYFMDNEIHLSDELMISEYETVDSLKNYLKDIILAPPQLIKLYINGICANESITVKEIISEGKKVEIRLNEEIKLIKTKLDKKKSKNIFKSFRPKVKSIKDKQNEEKETVFIEKKEEEQKENEFIEENDNKNLFIGEDDEQFFKTIEQIGEGETFDAYKVIDTRTKTTMCKKIVKLGNKKDPFKLQQIAYLEHDVSQIINHPCICKMYGINIAEKIQTKEEEDDEITTISLYLEYLDYKLEDYIKNNSTNYTMKTKIVVEIVHGMICLHKHNIIHRDLKIQNILLDSNFNAKIVDFGLVKINESDSEFNLTMTKCVGSISYMSPEMENGDDYDFKTDVYSFGIVLYYIFVGELPKRKLGDEFYSILLPKKSESISKVCLDLISSCLSYQKEDRPTFDEILKLIRDNSYLLASNIDKELVEKRDMEINKYENILCK